MHLPLDSPTCGVPPCIAQPEVLLQRGHNHTVDFWCLGILMSEMLTGRHPFKSKGGNHMQTLRNIVNPCAFAYLCRQPRPRTSPVCLCLCGCLYLRVCICACVVVWS